MPILCVFRQKTETSRHRPITLSLSLNINKGRCLQVAFTEPWDSWTTVCLIFYAHYKSLEFMFLNKTIPVFTAATLYSNIRSQTLSVGNAYYTSTLQKQKRTLFITGKMCHPVTTSPLTWNRQKTPTRAKILLSYLEAF